MPAPDTTTDQPRLNGLCRDLLPAPWPEAAAAQAARVVIHLLGDDAGKVATAQGALASLRSSGLLPPRLLLRCLAGWPEDTPGELAELGALRFAVAFAVCVYPKRVFHMEDAELDRRVAAFREVVPFLAAGPVAALRESGRVPAAEMLRLEEFLADLSAGSLAGLAEPEREARLAGAALHLATCYPEELARMYGNWEQTGPAMRFLYRELPSPPSCVVHQDRAAGAPGWGVVRTALMGRHSDDAPGIELGLQLEGMAWRSLPKWPAAGDRHDQVRACWEDTWERLVSGFPYFGFRSHPAAWWRQCLEFWRPAGAELTAEQSGVVDPSSDAESEPDDDLSLDELRPYREGFRLVRALFYPLERDADPAAANEHYRAVLDALWSERLQRKLADDGDLPTALVQDIAARFAGTVRANQVNMMSFRLRLRMYAYLLGRRFRYRNSRLLGQRVRGRTPLQNERGLLPAAVLARAVPWAHSLLWAFTAHVFVYPRVNPQWPDPWDFHRYARELWHWANDALFEQALGRAAQDGSRPDAAAADPAAAPFRRLLEELRALPDPAAADAFVAGEKFAGLEADAHGALEHILGGPLPDAAAVQRWRNLAGEGNQHWVVPAWYLAAVQRLPADEAVRQMVLDPDEEAIVRPLAGAVAVWRAAPRSSR